ncbi:hypothetical protein K9M41_00595 [Candidatus Gracilibacteria bacterium]|nr:hypothetical protein [Candidatus Gracilibacteria bacterium]
MAKVPLQKVRLTGLKTHYKILMQELHRMGLLEIVENSEFIENSIGGREEHFGVFDLARIDFALNFLSPLEDKKSKVDAILAGGKLVMKEDEAKKKLKEFAPKSEEVLSQCESIEEKMVRSHNELRKIRNRREILLPFKLLKTPLEEDFSTESTKTWLGFIPETKNVEKAFMEELAGESNLVDVQIFGVRDRKLFVRVTVVNSLQSQTVAVLEGFKFEEIDFSLEFSDFYGQKPREILHSLEKEEKEYLVEIEDLKNRAKGLVKHINDLRILADYNSWRKKKNDLQHQILKTKHIFAFEAWMPAKEFDNFSKWIENAFVNEVVIEKTNPNEDEEIPVLTKNTKGIASFEPITEMFGTPNNDDLDPTAAIAPFFFVFFGLCLSDVGYGLILMLASLWIFLFGKFSPKAKEGIFLLVLCGFGATLGGIILGGYFGMTPEQAPAFLLSSGFLTGTADVMPFRYQLIDPMAGSGPIIFLGLSMALGVIQILTGIVLDFVRKLKNREYADAIFGPLPWLYSLIVLICFSLADVIGLDKELFGKLAIAGAIILVLTQGRSQKNWLLKPIFGVLGLYNITGYVSDLLSYSRIMALGLATGVIGFAMNLTAGILGSMMPIKPLGIIVAIIILICGHGLNFSLSLLGAFVHSGRLQFIEFFGKFFEGGGRKFRPFVREKKYLFFNNS